MKEIEKEELEQFYKDMEKDLFRKYSEQDLDDMEKEFIKFEEGKERIKNGR